MTDFFNPNTWPLHPSREWRIYGDDNAQTWGIVDEDDYHFLINWKWSWSDSQLERKKPKKYLKRNFEEQIESPYKAGGLWENPETGRIVRLRKPRVQKTLRMHTVIMLRSGITPPSPDFILVDHRDGDEMNYRKTNLRWSNYKMNNTNINGSHSHVEEWGI